VGESRLNGVSATAGNATNVTYPLHRKTLIVCRPFGRSARPPVRLTSTSTGLIAPPARTTGSTPAPGIIGAISQPIPSRCLLRDSRRLHSPTNNLQAWNYVQWNSFDPGFSGGYNASDDTTDGYRYTISFYVAGLKGASGKSGVTTAARPGRSILTANSSQLSQGQTRFFRLDSHPPTAT